MNWQHFNSIDQNEELEYNTRCSRNVLCCTVLGIWLSPFKSMILIQHDKRSIPKIISLSDANDTGVWQEILFVLSLYFIL